MALRSNMYMDSRAIEVASFKSEVIFIALMPADLWGHCPLVVNHCTTFNFNYPAASSITGLSHPTTNPSQNTSSTAQGIPLWLEFGLVIHPKDSYFVADIWVMLVGETRVNFMSLNATSDPLPRCLASHGGKKRTTYWLNATHHENVNLHVPSLSPRLGIFL